MTDATDDDAKTKRPALRVIEGGPKKPARPRKGAKVPPRARGGVSGSGKHQVDPRIQAIVQLSAAIGYNKEQAAGLARIDPKTLTTYYQHEYEHGGEAMTAKIAANLATIASSPTHPRAVTAAIFWLTNRAGWINPLARGAAVADEDESETRWSVSIGDKAKGA
jgi:hypothetical protein